MMEDKIVQEAKNRGTNSCVDWGGCGWIYLGKHEGSNASNVVWEGKGVSLWR